MRIVVFGTGGAGGYFGGRLAAAGEDVTFVARGEHLRAIHDHGLCIQTPAGETVIRPARVTDDVPRLGEVDVVLVGVKAWQDGSGAGVTADPGHGHLRCAPPEW